MIKRYKREEVKEMEYRNTVLYVEKQESLGQQKITKDGHPKEVHYIVKNVIFTIYLRSALDFNVAPLTAALLYDFEEDEEQREVEAVKAKPLDYVAHISDDGDAAAIEAKIGVLSSQFQGVLFVIRFTVKDPETNMLHSAYTHPIKVVSKRGQVQRLVGKRDFSNIDSSLPSSPMQSPAKRQAIIQQTPPPPPPPSDSIAMALIQLQAQQAEQQNLLKTLLEREERKQGDQGENFESAFLGFLKALDKIPAKERRAKIRQAIDRASDRDTRNLIQFVSIFTANSNQIPSSGEALFPTLELPNISEVGNNGTLKPEQLDELYQNFLMDSLTSPEHEQ